MPSLGNCIKCQGGLCLAGSEVRCERCGTPQVDHPVAVEAAAHKLAASKPPPVRDVGPVDYPSTWGERLVALERRVAALEAENAGLRKAARR